jgi:hypothetical protein
MTLEMRTKLRIILMKKILASFSNMLENPILTPYLQIYSDATTSVRRMFWLFWIDQIVQICFPVLK